MQTGRDPHSDRERGRDEESDIEADTDTSPSVRLLWRLTDKHKTGKVRGRDFPTCERAGGACLLTGGRAPVMRFVSATGLVDD